jgi:hypothetical protein
VPIWPGAVPNAMPNPKPESVGPPEGREWWPRANDVSRPTMTVYAAKGRNTGVAVVVWSVVGREEQSACIPESADRTAGRAANLGAGASTRDSTIRRRAQNGLVTRN